MSHTQAENMRSSGAVLLISCYELGHQPMGAAMPLGFLERAGYSPTAIDVSVEPLDLMKVSRARFVGIAVPMHTALRLGIYVVKRVREVNPEALICLYGLYAGLNADYLLDNGADFCIAGEYELPLLTLIEMASTDELSSTADVSNLPDGVIGHGVEARPFLKRLPFSPPSRGSLPALHSYARLAYRGEHRLVGYVEGSRGCKYLCTHCPIPPVYDGRFFVVPQEVVLEDIRQQVQAGATHITFGDPDFLNGPTHSLRLVRAMHAEFPCLTFDFTTKVEHIIKHRDVFSEFNQLGCLFIVSAVESLSDPVLQILEKNHTRRDVEEAIEIVHAENIALRPTWVAFTPWTSLHDYLEVFEFVLRYGLIDHVDPVQYAVRLLIPPGSHLLIRDAMKPHLGSLDQSAFSYHWSHPDPRMDELHKTVSALVEKNSQAGVDECESFYSIWEHAASLQVNVPPKRRAILGDREKAPRLTEPWFC